MKRRVLLLVVVLIAVAAVFKFCGDKPEPQPAVVQQGSDPLSIAENSSSFNQSFTDLLNAYYGLKDALVSSNPGKADAAAADLQRYADSLRTGEIHGDTSGTIRETAKYFASSIAASAGALSGQDGLEGKRKEFETISDAMWSLTRTVQYSGQKVYYQYCPMAFDNKGAYWMSNTRDINNPYFGDKMLKCGEVADSLDYSKR